MPVCTATFSTAFVSISMSSPHPIPLYVSIKQGAVPIALTRSTSWWILI
jgi:hypothetical protein